MPASMAVANMDKIWPRVNVGDVSAVLKHRATGELLGVSAPFSIPTKAVLAVLTAEGWRETEQPEHRKQWENDWRNPSRLVRRSYDA